MSNLLEHRRDIFQNQTTYEDFLSCYDFRLDGSIPDRYRCNKCKKTFRGMYYAFVFIGKTPPEYNYFPDDSHYYCLYCMTFYEMVYIYRLYSVQLPLLINHMWITPQADQFYKDRLSNPMSECQMEDRIRSVDLRRRNMREGI